MIQAGTGWSQKLVKPQCCRLTIGFDIISQKRNVPDSAPVLSQTAQPELLHRHHPSDTRTSAHSCCSHRVPTEAGLVPEICCAAAATVRVQTCSLRRGRWQRGNTALHFNNSRGSSPQLTHQRWRKRFSQADHWASWICSNFLAARI